MMKQKISPRRWQLTKAPCGKYSKKALDIIKVEMNKRSYNLGEKEMPPIT